MRIMNDIHFTHLTNSGEAYMVDVTAKQPTVREATAIGRVRCSQAIIAALREGRVPKGDVLAVARIAGIQAAKRVPELLPLAHTIGIHGARVELALFDDAVGIRATVRTADRTGVEMEALTAVNVAALAIVDMVKGVDRSAEITDCKIIHKAGGRSGDWYRPGYSEESVAGALEESVRFEVPAAPSNA
jgi:cyclic pyranopterin phosphate synthase